MDVENIMIGDSQDAPAGGIGSGVRTLLAGFAFFWSVCLAFAGTTYYVASNGVSGNTGRSTNSPWPITYALLNVAASNTIVVMPGTYRTNLIVRHSYQTLVSQTKWGAKIVVPAGVNSAGISVWPAPINHVTIDGFEVANAGMSGVILYGSNCVVRNCWVHDSGRGRNMNNGSGILTFYPQDNTIIEGDLLENNGYSTGYDHGMYVSGTNCIIRNNVCRGNFGFGISVYDNHGGASDHCQVYNNLLYGNHGDINTNGFQLGFNSPLAPGTTNYAFGNTIITTHRYGILCEYTTVLLTNNIIISTGSGVMVYSPTGKFSWAYGDYNLAPQTLTTSGAHDVITNNYDFVNSISGLFWLTTNSPARGMAKGTVHGAIDFFGNSQPSVADVGAFQYNAAYVTDTRILDPSPVKPDYWLLLTLILPPSDLHIFGGF